MPFGRPFRLLYTGLISLLSRAAIRIYRTIRRAYIGSLFSRYVLQYFQRTLERFPAAVALALRISSPSITDAKLLNYFSISDPKLRKFTT